MPSDITSKAKGALYSWVPCSGNSHTEHPPPPTCGQTENITFSQLRWQVVIKPHRYDIYSNFVIMTSNFKYIYIWKYMKNLKCLMGHKIVCKIKMSMVSKWYWNVNWNPDPGKWKKFIFSYYVFPLYRLLLTIYTYFC